MAIIPTTSGGLGATAPIVGPDDVADESQVIPEAGAQEPLFSFGDQELYDQKVEELGIDGVARDVVGFAKMQLPSFNFTYEELRDGSADILDIVNVASDLPTSTRALSDEAILALFTDVEDYGKYDPPVALKNRTEPLNWTKRDSLFTKALITTSQLLPEAVNERLLRRSLPL